VALVTLQWLWQAATGESSGRAVFVATSEPTTLTPAAHTGSPRATSEQTRVAVSADQLGLTAQRALGFSTG
jgi:hypothetical protein